MKPLNLVCVGACGFKTEHREIRAHLTASDSVPVVMACVVCSTEQTKEVTKDLYFGRPPISEVRFQCEICRRVETHAVNQIVRGQKAATVVLHCVCNHEVRRYYSLEEIPPEVMAGEPKT